MLKLVVALAALCVASSAGAADRFVGQVVGVSDGDTITVIERSGGDVRRLKVRIAGIDAPERKQAFGTVATRAMSDLVFGKPADLACRSTDRYGRGVCVVRVGGVDAGHRLIELGLAWHYKRYASEQPSDEAAAYALAEDMAKRDRLGLWRDQGTAVEPVAPWDWRQAQRAAATIE